MKFTRRDSTFERSSHERTPTPNVPVASGTLALDRWAQGVRFGGGELDLGALGGAQRIGVNLVELAPGRQSCPRHWHVKEEEHFYVLSGRCVLRSGDDRHDMGPGDYVCFPANTGIAHAFENPFAEPCRLLAIGNRDPDEIAVYPDSGKMKLRALDRIVPLPAQGLDYWNGEATEVELGDAAGDDPRARAARKVEADAREAEQRERQVDDDLAAMKKRLGLE